MKNAEDLKIRDIIYRIQLNNTTPIEKARILHITDAGNIIKIRIHDNIQASLDEYKPYGLDGYILYFTSMEALYDWYRQSDKNKKLFTAYIQLRKNYIKNRLKELTEDMNSLPDEIRCDLVLENL